MKVIPRPNASSAAGWLTDGEQLVVLAMSNAKSHGTRYLLWSTQQEAAALFPAVDFEITDSSLSESWVASLEDTGYVYLAPRVWHLDGFWERYHEGDSAAEQAFAVNMAYLLDE